MSHLAVLLCGVVVLVAVTNAGAPWTRGAPADRQLFGTLLTDADHADVEHAAGVRVVELELGWSSYEPAPGQFNQDYVAAQQAKLGALTAAGMKVVLGVGLQYPPGWILSQHDSRYVNQFGARSDAANLTFNQRLRTEAERYIARVAQDFDPTSFWAIRVGSGGLVEALYPAERDSAGHANSYWAYDPAAQGGSNRPSSIPPNPFPGWQPGQRTWQGHPFSPVQVEQWYDWYVAAMVDGVNWQIATYRANGFTGFYQVLMPGVGSLPADVTTAVGNYLDGSADPSGTLGAGAVWNRVIDDISDRNGVVAYVSSVGDGSGHDDSCRPGDRSVGLDDAQILGWSATRWISYNADRYGMLKGGENPAPSDAPAAYGVRMLSAASGQMQSCNFQVLMWAHDSDLFNPSGPVSLNDLADTIAQANAANRAQ